MVHPQSPKNLWGLFPLLVHPSQLTRSQRDDVDGRVYWGKEEPEEAAKEHKGKRETVQKIKETKEQKKGVYELHLIS